MRLIFLILAVSVAGWSQTLTEGAAAIAGGAVGGAAGKKVGEGVGGILDKVAGTAAKAADDKDKQATKQAKPAPALEVGTGVAKAGAVTDGGSPGGSSAPGSTRRSAPKAATRDRSLVPPPPPLAHESVAKVEPPPPPPPVVEAVAPPPPPPPPPEVTPEDLKGLTNGADRLTVLKLGPPASRVSMAEAGHLLEIYSYSQRDRNFGVVRLSDGVVSSIEIHP
jgi:hypothetical protein